MLELDSVLESPLVNGNIDIAISFTLIIPKVVGVIRAWGGTFAPDGSEVIIYLNFNLFVELASASFLNIKLIFSSNES